MGSVRADRRCGPLRPQIPYSFILKRRFANWPSISIARRSRIVYRWLCFAKWSCVSIARKSCTDCHWLRSALCCIDRHPSRFSVPTADRDQSNWLRSTRFASPLMSASCSPPTADSQSNDCPGRHRACDDVSPSALAPKRDWFKTRLSLSCPSCTKLSLFKSHLDNDLRDGSQKTAFFRVRHGVSCNVIGCHGSSRYFDDFVRSFQALDATGRIGNMLL